MFYTLNKHTTIDNFLGRTSDIYVSTTASANATSSTTSQVVAANSPGKQINEAYQHFHY